MTFYQNKSIGDTYSHSRKKKYYPHKKIIGTFKIQDWLKRRHEQGKSDGYGTAPTWSSRNKESQMVTEQHQLGLL